MSRHEGRVLIATVNIDLATTPLNNATFTQIIASLGADTVRVDISSTVSDTIQIGVGASSTEKVVCQVGPEVQFQQSYLLLNKGQRISLISVFDATINSGRISLAFYN